ncbi:carboxypeptidase-like regulatory domain-containing protein [Polaribacter sp. R77954]|uniref:carboxypeptidase-like regulatory domain-containing protein n=1 Tax=Polaribacter sp. R77954 TaxID=3093870 RepID=UPI0037C94907
MAENNKLIYVKKKCFNKTLLITTFFVITFFSLNSQNILIEGKVSDTIKKPLTYANIIAEPLGLSKMVYAFSDNEGYYKLYLKKNEKYIVRVSYIGFKPQKKYLQFKKDTLINFKLIENTESLKEIKIDASLALSFKKDTITYKTDKFTNGNERKLRDILKKLPGIEVDKIGNVTVLGKKVTKVLVENKQFFTGDSKLAVNNIPADAVNEVEILENYNEVAILKGLEDSNDIAMNIKLKENKKKFWFGDIVAGLGVTDRKVVHPSLFYYSPKRSVNFIGDLNNTGKKSFTFKDYLDFEGGYNKILLNPKAYFSKLNDGFSKFLTNQNFENSNHVFLGGNITESISKKSDLIGYTIYSKSVNELRSKNINTFINNNSNLREERIIKQKNRNQFVISKISIDNTQNDGTKFKATSFVKFSNNFSKNSTITNLNNNIRNIFTTADANNFSFKQDVEFYKSLTENQTLTFLTNYNYSKSNTIINWETNNDIFQDIIPIIDEQKHSIFKDKKTSSHNLSTLLKHYWVIADFIHLYTTTGIDIYKDKIFTDEYQLLSDKRLNNFNTAGFGNDIEFDFINSFAGSILKFQKNKFTITTSLFYHNYLRQVAQINSTKSLNKKYFLPEFSIRLDVKRSEKLSLKYNLKVRFPSINKLLQNYTLTNFNSVYRGRNDLENELYHQLRLYYFKFSLFKKINYNLSLNYKKTKSGIRNTNILDGINYITEPVFLDNANENISFNGSLGKTYGSFKISLNGSNSYSKYLQLLNTKLQRNSSRNYSFGGGLKSDFLKFPNMEISYRKSLDKYMTPNNISNFENENLTFNFEYDLWNDYILKASYSLEKFTNKNQNSSNQNEFLNTSLYYQKENSLWSFEIYANNLFNSTFKRNNSFTDFLISDSKTFILPRIIMLKVSYKLD